MMLLQLKDISKSLGKFRIKDISVELPEGYIMGLIGPNGSGKTSLIHIILGLYKANAGELLIDGMSYKDSEVEIRNLIGTVLLDELFDHSATLKENGINYGAYYKNFKLETLEMYMKRFGLDGDRKF